MALGWMDLLKLGGSLLGAGIAGGDKQFTPEQKALNAEQLKAAKRFNAMGEQRFDLENQYMGPAMETIFGNADATMTRPRSMLWGRGIFEPKFGADTRVGVNVPGADWSMPDMPGDEDDEEKRDLLRPPPPAGSKLGPGGFSDTTDMMHILFPSTDENQGGGEAVDSVRRMLDSGYFMPSTDNDDPRLKEVDALAMMAEYLTPSTDDGTGQSGEAVDAVSRMMDGGYFTPSTDDGGPDGGESIDAASRMLEGGYLLPSLDDDVSGGPDVNANALAMMGQGGYLLPSMDDGTATATGPALTDPGGHLQRLQFTPTVEDPTAGLAAYREHMNTVMPDMSTDDSSFAMGLTRALTSGFGDILNTPEGREALGILQQLNTPEAMEMIAGGQLALPPGLTFANGAIGIGAGFDPLAVTQWFNEAIGGSGAGGSTAHRGVNFNNPLNKYGVTEDDQYDVLGRRRG